MRRRSRARWPRYSLASPEDDRIKVAQKNIQEMLAAKPEYVVTTSEFSDVEGAALCDAQSPQVDDKTQTVPS